MKMVEIYGLWRKDVFGCCRILLTEKFTNGPDNLCFRGRCKTVNPVCLHWEKTVVYRKKPEYTKEIASMLTEVWAIFYTSGQEWICQDSL